MARRLAVFVLLLAASVAGAAHGASDTAKPSRLQLTGSLWSPYIDPLRPGGGLAAELVTAALTRGGYETKTSLETWPRAYEGTASGVYDVVISVWKTPEREKELLFSEPYLLNDIVLFSQKGRTLPFKGLDDLVGFTIGVENQFAYGGGFDERADLKRVVNNSLIENLLLLRRGKIDLVIGDRWSLYYALTTFMPDSAQEIEMLPNALVRRALHMGVSRQRGDAAKIVADFNRELEAMNKDGTYRKILDKHTGSLAVVQPGG
jgi:polar amino acid transport system substrate-binding protein